MTEFNIKLADEVFTVRCSQEYTRSRFAGFETEERGEILQNNREMMKKYRLMLEEKRRRIGIEDVKQKPNVYDFSAIFDLAAHALVPHGVLLVHGSVVVANDSAVMFLAPSGVGKSTHTHLWTKLLGENAFIINDDKPFVRPNGDVPVVYASPWGLVKPAPAVKSAPLKAVVLLRRGENRIEPIGKTELLPALMQASLRSKNPAETFQIMLLQQKLLEQTALWQMTCTPDITAAEMAYRAIFNA